MKRFRQFMIVMLIITLSGINKQLIAQDNENKADVFTIVEKAPEFPGGDKARVKFLIKNLVYPKTARETGIEGTVFISFVVETDGSISHSKVIRGIGGGCDEEAIRVIKLMPKWEPGKQSGKNVRVQFNMPFKFTLSNDKVKEETKKSRK
ncbi:MAG: energy transducer TonB [Bacteroidales bacterium]